MKIKYKINDWECFEDTVKSLNRFITGNGISIERLNCDIAEISDKYSSEWHLAELGNLYGVYFFKKHYQLDVIDICKTSIKIDSEQEIFLVENKWYSPLQFNPKYLNLAESNLLTNLTYSLSEASIKQMNSEVKELELKKGKKGYSSKYAYQIINKILLLIESSTNTITYMWQTEWNEKYI